MIRNYIKTAFRSLKKNKGFTIINVLGLALGLAMCLLIVFYVVDELCYDRYNTKFDRIYRVNADIKFGGNASSYAVTQPPLAAALNTDFPEVERAVRLIQGTAIRFKRGSENVDEVKTVYADPGLFDVFTLPMLQGDPKTVLDEPQSIVITETAAKRYFNRTNVLGQTLTIVNENKPYKITGIIRDMPAQSHFNFDFFMSMSSLASSLDATWNTFSFNTYVALKPGADPKRLEAQFPQLLKQRIKDVNFDNFAKIGNYIRLNLTPLKDIHLRSNRGYELGVNSSIDYIYIFSAIAIFILLIACINFMNLSTARSSNRAREVGVRKVLGSPRKYLIAQFLSESVLVTLFAAVIAVGIAILLLPLFNEVSGKQLILNAGIYTWLLPVLLVVVLVIGLLAGFYPAFFLSAFQPIDVLKGKISAGFKGGGLRSFLVVFQFAISIFLIIGTIVIYNQLNYIQNRDLGFDRNQVLIIKKVNVLDKSTSVFKQQVEQIPGVASATLSSYLPTSMLGNPLPVFSSKNPDARSAMFTELWPVDENYIATMGMRIVKGRNFSKEMATDSLAVIINETAAKMLGYKDPLNRNIYNPVENDGHQVSVKEYHIVGVMKDFNFKSLRDNITPVVMTMAGDGVNLSVRVSTQKLPALLTQIENKWSALSPNEHVDYSFMDKDFDAMYRSEQRIGTLFTAFTTLAIVIACLGLFGLAAYAAEQRTKEIGIRKVLGAGVGTIVSLLSKDFIKLVLIAIIIASPLSWYVMNKWLQDFAYRMDINWWILALAAIAAILIAFVTISFQSVKAALANPVKSLRSE